jgi:hypothetical protein
MDYLMDEGLKTHSKGNEIGLESTLSEGKKIGLESALSGGRGLENALGRKKDRARKYIIWRTRAKKHIQKERDRARKRTIQYDKRYARNHII